MKKLKKIVLKIPIDPRYKKFFDLVEKYEIFQIHRYDENQINVTQKAKFKDTKMHPKMLEGKRYGMPYIEVLGEDKVKNEYIFFSKHNWIEEMRKFFGHLDIIIEPPIILDQDRLLISFLTDNKDIDEILDSQASIFNEDFEILSISLVHPNFENLYLILTDRQKEIAFYATQHGYYEIPRMITSKALADHFNISRSALCEHLRKIEKILFNSVFK